MPLVWLSSLNAHPAKSSRPREYHQHNQNLHCQPSSSHPPTIALVPCRFIFRTFFECFEFERLIIIEDDMLLAPDFFSYFLATGKVMDRDPSLLCVSSWNDHGQVRGRSKGAGGLDKSIELRDQHPRLLSQQQFVRDEAAVWRTDFFPGLGWLTSRNVWHTIRGGW